MKDTKRLTKKLLAGLFCALVSGSGYASAMPTGAHDLQNISGITQSGNIMDIAGKGNAVAKWQDFSLKQGETVNFKGMQNVLNIVDGNKFSDIRGNINGQGVNVFLVNPSGVLFGDTSKVNVGSLTVSTQEISKNLAEEFTKNGTIATDASKLGIGNVTFVGNVDADSIRVTGNNISLVNTNTLNAQNISLTTPNKGFINVLKGQDTSKLNVAGGTVRDDFEAIDSKDKLKNIKHDGHYMLTKDITVDDSWEGIKSDKTEVYSDYVYDSNEGGYVKTDVPRNITDGLVLNGMGHSVGNINKVGFFGENTKLYNSDISNLTMAGGKIANTSAEKSAFFAEEAKGVKIDNITSDIKAVDTNSNSYGGSTGWFRNVYDSKFTNLTNNTDITSRNTGNIAYITYNTDYINIINNGAGYAGIVDTIYGGDLIGCVNTGDAIVSGMVKSYYNYYYDKDNNKVYKPVNIKDNINKGQIAQGENSTSDVAGIIGFAIFDGIEGERAATIENNTNYGDIQSLAQVGGIVGRIKQYNTVDGSYIYMSNNKNYGDIYGTNQVGGIAGYIGGANFVGEHLYNYGSYVGNNSKAHGGIGSQVIAGGIIGELDGMKDVSLSYVENHAPNNVVIDKVDNIDHVGGIVGYVSAYYPNSILSIDHAKNLGDIWAGNVVGGIVGGVNGIDKLSISDSYNKGNIYSYNYGNPTQFDIGGIIGETHDVKSVEINNVFNTGNIKGVDNTTISSVGGLIGHIMVKNGSTAKINNVFNTGNLENVSYYAGGIVGSNMSPLEVANAYTTGNIYKKDFITLRDGTIEDVGEDYTHSAGLLVGQSESISLKNVYSTGEIIHKDSDSGNNDGNVLIGQFTNRNNDDSLNARLHNVYSMAKDTTVFAENKGGLSVSSNVIQIGNDKKAASYEGFDIDTNGSRPDATWRIYEGYTNPLLTVFMNNVNLDDTSKTVTYTGRELTYSKDDLTTKNNFGVPNFFTDDIDYSKESHVYDGKDGKEFEKVAGTEVGTYKTKIYSDQFGYNFHSTANDETLTLTVEPAPAPTPVTPTPEVTPVSPKTPVVNIGANKIVRINVVNQTGSYKDRDYEEHTLLNKKEVSRAEQIDEQNIVEVVE